VPFPGPQKEPIPRTNHRGPIPPLHDAPARADDIPGYAGKTDDRGHGLALLYGLAGPDQWPAIKTVLTTSFEASPYMEKFILESLFRTGDTEAALTRLKKRYQTMVESELSTLWEGWGMGPGWGIGPEGYGGGSYNHGWSGGPLTLLGEYVAGISPATPGFATYQVKPQPGPLRRVRAGVDTVRGRIEVGIDRDESAFRLRLVSPPDTLATVVLPVGASVECNGRPVWPTTGKENSLHGVKCQGEDAGHVRFTVPAGIWEFISSRQPLTTASGEAPQPTGHPTEALQGFRKQIRRTC